MEKNEKQEEIITAVYKSHNPYIDGVKGVDGDIALRPLNEEEIKFLNKFNREFNNAEFNNDNSDLHFEMIENNKKTISELKNKIKHVSELLRKSDRGYRKMNSEERIAYKQQRIEWFKEKSELIEQLEAIDSKGNIQKSKYNRRFDLANSKRTSNITDLSGNYFNHVENESTSRSDCSETELFDNLKKSPIIED